MDEKFEMGRLFVLAAIAGWLPKLAGLQTTFLTCGKEKVEMRLWLSLVVAGIDRMSPPAYSRSYQLKKGARSLPNVVDGSVASFILFMIGVSEIRGLEVAISRFPLSCNSDFKLLRYLLQGPSLIDYPMRPIGVIILCVSSFFVVLGPIYEYFRATKAESWGSRRALEATAFAACAFMMSAAVDELFFAREVFIGEGGVI